MRIALVGGDLVVQVGFGTGPIPKRDHDVALHALWARRRGREFASGDARGPIAEHGEGALLAQASDAADHRTAGLSGLYAALPGLGWRIECAEGGGNFARRLGAELMAGPAAIGLDELEVFGLALACWARCRCLAGRCRGIRSCRGRVAANTRSWRDNIVRRRGRRARSTALRFSVLPGDDCTFAESTRPYPRVQME